MSRVYSYMRWSTVVQGEKSTEDRQRLAQEAFCRHYGYTLAEELTDPGMSSFRGKNAHEGKLREVIERAKRGDIPPGSLLLFENADRMTRMGLSDAVPLFFEILGAGLKIGIADRLQIYTPGTLDLGGLMTILVDMSRANAESQRKSDFSRKGWKDNHKRMESGEVVTDKVAQWLTVERVGEERKFVEVKEVADQIRAMFKLALQYGVAETCRRVNEQFGSTWKVYQLQYLLKNRRLIGEHTITNFDETAGKNLPSDRVLTNYYPLIIEPNLFAEVQAVVNKRRPFAGRQSASNLNIYRGLVFCAGCGGSVRFMVKTGKEYFMCTNSMSHTCTVPGVQSIRGEHLRRLLFRFEHWTNLKSYFMEHSDDLKTLARERDELLALIDKIAVRTKQTEQRVMDEDDQDRQEAFIGILAKAKGADRIARAKLADAEAKLAEMEDAFSIAGFDIGDRVEWMLDDRSEEAALERARINRYLTTIFEKMIINFQAKTLDTFVREPFQGKVRPLHAGISAPADKRFKKAPVTGTIRISGRTGPKKPHTQPPMFTTEELAELKGVGWETVTEVIPKKKPVK